MMSNNVVKNIHADDGQWCLPGALSFPGAESPLQLSLKLNVNGKETVSIMVINVIGAIFLNIWLVYRVVANSY